MGARELQGKMHGGGGERWRNGEEVEVEGGIKQSVVKQTAVLWEKQEAERGKKGCCGTLFREIARKVAPSSLF